MFERIKRFVLDFLILDELPVQINGKRYFKIIVSKSLSMEEVATEIRKSTEYKKHQTKMSGSMTGYDERIIVVPHRIANIIWMVR